MAEKYSYLTDSERSWVRVPVGLQIFFPSLRHLVAQCGSTLVPRAAKSACSVGSSVVPSRFEEE